VPDPLFGLAQRDVRSDSNAGGQFESMSDKRRRPPDILLKCYDVWGTEVVSLLNLSPYPLDSQILSR